VIVKHSIPKRFFKDLKTPGPAQAFFICLLLSAMFWLVHRLNTVYTLTKVRFAVNFENTPYRKRPLKQLPEQLELDLKGSGLSLLWLTLKSEQPILHIDFNSLLHDDAFEKFTLKPEAIKVGYLEHLNITVKQVYPNQFIFSAPGKYSKIIPVKIPLDLKFKPEHDLITIQYAPEYVRIWGDSLTLLACDTLFTNGLTHHQIEHDIHATLAVIPPDTTLKIDVQFIDVDLKIGRWNTIKQEQNIALIGPCTDFEIHPKTVQVHYKKLEATNCATSKQDLKLKVLSNCQYTKHKSDVFTATVPENCKVISILPSQVVLFPK
jgi:hypothetical protein